MYKRPCKDNLRITLTEPLALFVLALAIRMSLLPYWQNLQLSGDEIYYWTSAHADALKRKA